MAQAHWYQPWDGQYGARNDYWNPQPGSWNSSAGYSNSQVSNFAMPYHHEAYHDLPQQLPRGGKGKASTTQQQHSSKGGAAHRQQRLPKGGDGKTKTTAVQRQVSQAGAAPTTQNWNSHSGTQSSPAPPKALPPKPSPPPGPPPSISKAQTEGEGYRNLRNAEPVRIVTREHTVKSVERCLTWLLQHPRGAEDESIARDFFEGDNSHPLEEIKLDVFDRIDLGISRKQAEPMLRAHYGKHCTYTLYEIATSLGWKYPSKRSTLVNATQNMLFDAAKIDTLTVDVACLLARNGAHGLAVDLDCSTPLHTICLRIASGGPSEYDPDLFSWLVDRWPLALLMENASGMWPASYFMSADATDLPCPVLIRGLAKCVDLYPAKVQSLFRNTRFDRMITHLEGACCFGEKVDTVRDVEVLRLARHTAFPDFDYMEGCATSSTQRIEELHDRMQRVIALQGLVGSSDEAIAHLEKEELRAKLVETATLLEKQQSDTRKEVERLEKKLASERQQRQEQDERIKALQDVANHMASDVVHGTTSNGVIVKDRLSQKTVDAQEHRESMGTSSAADVISRVRKKRLVDVDVQANLPKEVQEGVQSIQASLSRAVERLAKDLYASDAHALHELLQNADDCTFLPNKEPSVQFWLGEKDNFAYFAAEINEIGFKEADVWALSDINASTKAEGKSTSIGKKGIGWKSVFLLSDTPHILSNDYTFKFDITGPLGLLGYVTPTMLTKIELEALPEEVRIGWQKGHTVFYVPLRNAANRLALEAELRQLCSSRDDVSSFPAPLPMALLFLRKLRNLSIRILGSSAHAVRFSREADAQQSQYVTLQKFELVKTSLDSPAACDHQFFLHSTATADGDLQLAFLVPHASDKSINSDARPGIEGTPSNDNAENDTTLGWVFTYLPVRCVGFQFALNAPFELTASRGDLHYDSLQNLRLRDAIPGAFQEAIAAEAKASVALGRSPFLEQTALQLLASDITDGWWRSARDAALARVAAGLACVPVEPSGVALLSECVMRGPKGSKARRLADCMPHDLLHRYLDLRFVREDATTLGVVSNDVLKRLGCATFGLHEVLSCLKQGWSRFVWSSSGSIEPTEFFSALCDFLHYELLHAGDRDSTTSTASKQRLQLDCCSAVLEAIRDVPLFPVVSFQAENRGGRICRLKDGRFFRRFCTELPRQWQLPLVEIGIIDVLDPELLRLCGEQSLAPFLDTLRVASPSLIDIASLVIETHATRDYDTIQSCVAGLACVREFWARGQDIPNTPEMAAFSHLWKKVHQVIRIPDEVGSLRPTRQLECRTTFGLSCPLPPDVVQQVEALVGTSLPAELRCRVNPEIMSPEYLSQNHDARIARVECEAFLHHVGIHEMDLFSSSESQVICLELGKLFGSKDFWSGLLASPLAARYVWKRLAAEPVARLDALGKLDVQDGVTLSDFFLKQPFLKHGGRFLVYMDLDFTTVAKEDAKEHVLAALSKLGVSTEVSGVTLVKVWDALSSDRPSSHLTRRCEACEVYAELFVQILGYSCDSLQQKIRNMFLTDRCRRPIYAGREHGFITLSNCIWEQHREPSILKLAGVVALSTVYGRFGDAQRAFFLDVVKIAEKIAPMHCLKALGTLLEQVDAAIAVIAMGGTSAQSIEAGTPSGGWAFHRPLDLPDRACEVAKEIYLDLATILEEEKAESEAKVRNLDPLPPAMAEKLYRWLPARGRTLQQVEEWFTDEFFGVPVSLLKKLEISPEFTVSSINSGVTTEVKVYRSMGSTQSNLNGRSLELLKLSFQEDRLIIVPGRPRKSLGGSAVPTFKHLRSAEAYWNVAPSLQNCQCAAWALHRHYPAELESFFASIGVKAELSQQDLTRRLAEAAQHAELAAAAEQTAEDTGAAADPQMNWHSDGYEMGDFIGDEGDQALLNSLLDETQTDWRQWENDPNVAAATNRFIQQRSSMESGLESLLADTLDSMRQGQEVLTDDSIDLGVARGAENRSQFPIVQRDVPVSMQTLRRVGELAGVCHWTPGMSASDLSLEARTRAEECANMLGRVAHEVYRLPPTAINVVSASNSGLDCLGAFSAKFPGALFFQIPSEEARWQPTFEWAKAEIAHQLAHASAGEEFCNRRFCGIIEQLLTASSTESAA